MADSFDALPRHDVALVIGGTGYLGWTEVSIERSIDALVGSFTLTLAAKDATDAADFIIKAGDACQIVLGGKPLITGWVDKVDRDIDAETRSLTVTGRDKACDLVDCSAINKPGSWRNVTLTKIAQELAKPFGVSIAVTGDVGKPLSRFALQQGETAFAAIERLARYRGLIAFSDGRGGVIIGNPDSGQKIGGLREGRNVLKATTSVDHTQLFSQYLVKGQASGSDERHGKTVAQVKGEASDSAVTRYRPLLIVGEEQSDSANLKKRAAWEKQTRAGRAESSQITVPSWFTDTSGSGAVWEPGKRADCQLPSNGVSGERLIERVVLTRTAEDGTRSEITAVPPDAWAQLAESEPAPPKAKKKKAVPHVGD